jgi:predicted HAD superfamily Cof-like phosphohydrolase/ADP-ribose pyrophosphatase YjhB (NUDIX family)
MAIHRAFQVGSGPIVQRAYRDIATMGHSIDASTTDFAPQFRLLTRTHLLLLEDGKALFRQGHTDGVYQLPSVQPEEGESVVEAIVREARRAVGVTVKPENVSLAHVTQDLSSTGGIALFFAVSSWDGEPINMEPQRFRELRWLPLRSLPGNVANPTRAAVRNYVSGETFSTTVPTGNGVSDTNRSLRFRSDVARAVAAFHEAFDLPRQESPNVDIDASLAALRVALVEEEVGELVQAVAEHDLTAIADALADIVYVAYGTALTYGVDLDSVLAEVHRANMSKLGTDGRPVRREDGKVLKSDRYTPPDVTAVLGLPRRSPAARGPYSNKK